MNEYTTIGALVADLGVPVALSIGMLVIIGRLVNHLNKNTIPREVYTQTCDSMKALEKSVDNNTQSLQEVVAGQRHTNALVEMLMVKGGSS